MSSEKHPARMACIILLHPLLATARTRGDPCYQGFTWDVLMARNCPITKMPLMADVRPLQAHHSALAFNDDRFPALWAKGAAATIPALNGLIELVEGSGKPAYELFRRKPSSMWKAAGGDTEALANMLDKHGSDTVSYTHLTLPTIHLV